MINFTEYGPYAFQINLAQTHKRVYLVTLRRTIDSVQYVRLKNVNTGLILFEMLSMSDVMIEGVPNASISDLQDLVYNKSCDCKDGEIPPDDDGIFDDTFDDTFE